SNTFTPTGTPISTDTPTNTFTPTSTNTPGAGDIIGHLTWQGIPQPDARNAGVTATLSICVGGAATNYGVATDASGYFTVTAGLPGGSYNWRLKGVINLANAGTLSLSSGGLSPASPASVEMGTMRAGDANTSD